LKVDCGRRCELGLWDAGCGGVMVARLRWRRDRQIGGRTGVADPFRARKSGRGVLGCPPLPLRGILPAALAGGMCCSPPACGGSWRGAFSSWAMHVIHAVCDDCAGISLVGRLFVVLANLLCHPGEFKLQLLGIVFFQNVVLYILPPTVVDTRVNVGFEAGAQVPGAPFGG